jgi:hypothetical protein
MKFKGDPKCKTCDGEGYIESQCFVCHGSGDGRMDETRCLRCKGLGTLTEPCYCKDNTDDQINEMWSDEGIGGI